MRVVWLCSPTEVEVSLEDPTIWQGDVGVFKPKLMLIVLPGSMRFYPHDQDTGGFFVTVLEKKADAPLEDVRSGEAAGAPATAAEDVKMDPHEARPSEEQPCVDALSPECL